ncbi:hypothetical protein TBC1_12478 [Lentimicrobium saccharophilum]|uniref:Uncharacterized protein n=1 Tax=Lentimicrobium saccharophilum TaxID=1678841 RepID=A0A0S7C131_9BACT|nr:hypothetical protein TBC1_12478 [Lentimicrobium saccharophilum]
MFENVHHMCNTCTTIIRDCTTYVHRPVHYLCNDMYIYKKIL